MRKRLSRQSRAVLDAVEAGASYGYEVVAVTGLAEGTTYPILKRLEAAGRLVAFWEDGDPKALGRPLRRFYRSA